MVKLTTDFLSGLILRQRRPIFLLKTSFSEKMVHLKVLIFKIGWNKLGQTLFNERKLVLGLQHVKVTVKVKVQMKKFGTIVVLP